jgi:predicted metal-dependent enzyme (double-stranded beta helix superfamily)
MTERVARTTDERTLLAEGRADLARLLARDDWLPDRLCRAAQRPLRAVPAACRPAGALFGRQLRLGPGPATPVHDHTVWGLVGVLRGAERCDEYRLDDGRPVPTGRHHVMQPGDIEAVSPTVGDWHRVSSARADGPSVSIHVYGANIGAVRRHRLDDGGARLDFVSGYDSELLPNLWDRSAAVRGGA